MDKQNDIASGVFLNICQSLYGKGVHLMDKCVRYDAFFVSLPTAPPNDFVQLGTLNRSDTSVAKIEDPLWFLGR